MKLREGNVFGRVCLFGRGLQGIPIQGLSSPHRNLTPDMFQLDQPGHHHNATPQNVFKFVHYVDRTSVGKLVVGIRLKCLLV